MAKDHDKSLGDQNTFDGGVKRVESSQQSLGDQSTFGGGASSMAELDGLVGGADLEMEIVDLAARYTTEGTLGKGGMGEVLLATDTRLERKVAIKRILGEGSRSRTAVRRFLTEAKSIAKLNHPNIVQIHDYGRDEDGPFLIMEYVDGGSLLEKCREGALPLEEAVELTCQLCDGLGKAHEANIIHRDIKPANVLLTKTGIPKLTDFGLAKDETADTGLSMAGAVLGTLDFMPPEQRKDSALTDNRSDLWSLAATLYQMVTGEPPRVIDLDAVPQELRQTLARALKSKKDDRYQTAAEFRDALRASQKLQAAPEPVAELGAGECPKCHTKNEASRKFCSNGTCGGPLRVTCLACETEIPVWDQVCGDCGGKQAELIASRLEELESQRSEAEQHRSAYAYESALEIVRGILAIEDERISQQKTWAEEFLESVQSERDRETASSKSHYTEAQQHRAAFDYPSAIHSLESIPAALRSETVSSYLTRLASDQQKSEELIATISERVQRRDLGGLLEQVDRAVELRGDRADLQKLQTQLRDRRDKRIQQRDEAYEEAASLLSQGDARGAYRLIGTVKTSNLRSSDEQLRRQLEEIVAAEDKLTALVKESKADGILDPDEVVAMWQATGSYLELNPRHEKIAGMQQQLEARIQKSPAEYAAFGELADFWLKQPADVLIQLPASVLSQLPASVLSSVVVKMPVKSNTLGMEFKSLPGGTFTMGEGGEAHKVTLTKLFGLGVYEVTQKQYQQVMGTNPSNFKGPQNPVEQVSWNDAIEFCRKLSDLPSEKSAGYVYRLPTEAEWEYACRAGTTTKYSFGDSESELGDYAWYDKNSGGTTHPVGGKKPNGWGLYDMHGNVYEWCQDWYGSYPSGSTTDPTGAASGSYRVFRGGCWISGSGRCHSAYRFWLTPDYRINSLGFRVLRSSIK